MRKIIYRVKRRISGLLGLMVKAYRCPDGVKPEDWWRFHCDYLGY